MADAALTMDALHYNAATQTELGAIFTGFRSQVIVEPGEKVPPDPRMCRKAPDGSSTYAQCGGVYPLSTFVDCLVDLALASDELTIHWDDVKKAGGTRHPPGLKFLLTERMCSAAGGPEEVTATGFDDAKLGVLAEQWDPFMALVSRAAEQTWPGKAAVVGAVEALVQEQKPEICLGMVAPGHAGDAHKSLREAGYSHVQATAALLECDGKGDDAIALLKGGWALPPPTAVDMPEGAKCPLGHGAAAAAAPPPPPAGLPPPPAAKSTLPLNLATAVRTMATSGLGAAAIAATMKLDLADVEAALAAAIAPPPPPPPAGGLPGHLATVVRTMASKGMAAAAIAETMKLDVDAVQQTLDVGTVAAAEAAPKGRCPFGFDQKKAPAAVVTASVNPAILVETLRERFHERAHKAEGHVAGRVLSNDVQRSLDTLLVEPAELCCPITLMLFSSPVIASDGSVYESAAIRVVVQQATHHIRERVCHIRGDPRRCAAGNAPY